MFSSETFYHNENSNRLIGRQGTSGRQSNCFSGWRSVCTPLRRGVGSQDLDQWESRDGYWVVLLECIVHMRALPIPQKIPVSSLPR